MEIRNYRNLNSGCYKVEKILEMKKLLSAKRTRKRTNLDYSDYDPKKRTKTMTSHVNTRSVTRKLFNVGAMYQAPTNVDRSQWKKWPTHGMNERPVWHPNAGLAAEYLGKYYVTLDNSYHEIINQDSSEININYQKKVTPEKCTPNNYVSKSKPKSQKDLEISAHNNLHCVFAYCANVANMENETFKPKYQKQSVVKHEPRIQTEINNGKLKSLTKYCLFAQKGETSQEAMFKNAVFLCPINQSAKSCFEEKELNKKMNLEKPHETEVKKREIDLKRNLNLINFDDTSISDESLMELSSVYANFTESTDDCNSQNNNLILNKMKSSKQVTHTQKNRMNVEWNSDSVNSKNTAIVTIKDPIMKSNISPKIHDSSRLELISNNKIIHNISNMNEVLDLSKVKQNIKKETVNNVLQNEDKKDEDLLNLLQNAAISYCNIVGVHQDDLADYIDTLDAKQCIEWMQTYNLFL